MAKTPPKKITTPKYVSTIICDDVRRELSNKVSLLGVYNEDIVFDQLPATIEKLYIFQRWNNVPDDANFIFRINIGKRELPELKIGKKYGNLEPGPEPTPRWNIILGIGNLLFDNEGDLIIKTFLGEKSKKPIHREKLSIKLRPKP